MSSKIMTVLPSPVFAFDRTPPAGFHKEIVVSVAIIQT